jgi:flavin reductase (DIM6/NTAB) family NADH-FMN oxidoreductase RutF
MNQLKEINAIELSGNPFFMIGKEWMLITVKKGEQVNTMTASWGGLGVMWNKNVSYAVLRPQRFTKEFIDQADSYSLTFFDESYKKTLGYLGKVSGRDEDKIMKSGLSLDYIDGIPYFKEAKQVLLCNKLFASPFLEDQFIDKNIIPTMYPSKDFHTLYIGEVYKVLSIN